MVTSKELDKYFQETIAPVLGVKTNKNTPYSTKPSKDIYSLGKAYGGYRVEKQIKGSSGSADISDRYTAKEMKIYLKGMKEGVEVVKKKR